MQFLYKLNAVFCILFNVLCIKFEWQADDIYTEKTTLFH